jgi:hypothetical protein
MLEGGVTCREQLVCPPHLLYGEVVVILAEMLAVETVVRVCFDCVDYPSPVSLGVVLGQDPKGVHPVDRSYPSEDFVSRIRVNTIRPLPGIPEQIDTQRLALLESPRHCLCMITVYVHVVVDTVGKQGLKAGWEGQTAVKKIKLFLDANKRR